VLNIIFLNALTISLIDIEALLLSLISHKFSH